MTQVLPPPAAEPSEHTYGIALTRFLAKDSDASRSELSLLAREMAAQRRPISEVLSVLWVNARSALLSANDTARATILDRILESERAIGQTFDQSFQLDRRAHLRLASAYAQKIREVDTLLDSLPAFTFLKDGGLRYSSANRELCEALSISAREVVSKTDFDLFGEEVATRLAEQDRQVLRDRQPIRREESIDFGGDRRTILFIKAPLLNADGSAAGVIGVGFDLTERKRIESERARLATALESIGEAVIITDRQGAIQYVNPAFETVSGYLPQEVIGHEIREFQNGQEDGLGPQMSPALGRGETWHGSVTHNKKDGTLFDADQTVSPVHDASGAIGGYVTVARDITEEKRMLDSLRWPRGPR